MKLWISQIAHVYPLVRVGCFSWILITNFDGKYSLWWRGFICSLYTQTCKIPEIFSIFWSQIVNYSALFGSWSSVLLFLLWINSAPLGKFKKMNLKSQMIQTGQLFHYKVANSCICGQLKRLKSGAIELKHTITQEQITSFKWVVYCQNTIWPINSETYGTLFSFEKFWDTMIFFRAPIRPWAYISSSNHFFSS